MKKIILSLILVFVFFPILTRQTVSAKANNCSCIYGLNNGNCSEVHMSPCSYQCSPACQYPGTCCEPFFDPDLGTIDAPPGVSKLNEQAGGSGIGLILFFSNLIKLISIIGGLWVMLNFILAGFSYITNGGDSGKIEKIGSKLTLSVLGLAIIVASYAIAALLGLILFGDASFIINPKIPSITI